MALVATVTVWRGWCFGLLNQIIGQIVRKSLLITVWLELVIHL